MRAHQIMSRPVFTVTPETTMVEAANLMLQKHLSGLPVVEKSLVKTLRTTLGLFSMIVYWSLVAMTGEFVALTEMTIGLESAKRWLTSVALAVSTCTPVGGVSQL